MKIAGGFLVPLLILGAALVTWAMSSPIPLGLALIALVSTGLLCSLWNGTVAVVLGLRYITYWEAFRLLLLAWLLIGSALLSCRLVSGTSVFSR